MKGGQLVEEGLKIEAMRFVAALRANETIRGFLKAKDDFDTNGELAALRTELAALVNWFQRKQLHGTLTKEDISSLRTVQMKVSTHAVTIRFVSARNEAMSVLQDCNAAMSELLGIDFAAVAAPAGSCCG